MTAPVQQPEPRRRGRRSWALYAVAAVLLLAAGAAPVLLLTGGGEEPRRLNVPTTGEVAARHLAAAAAAFDPHPYDPDGEDELLARGRDGLEHVLYEKSPGGVQATAERVERLRPRVERAAEDADVDADTLEALVFLESAGRAEVVAGPTPESAVGLGQILPDTAVSLLGMSVDLERSKELTRAIERTRRRAARADTEKRGRELTRRMRRLSAERRAVDDRFDAAKSLAGAARYLDLAEARFGREDLAATSYHMGMGNLEQVIEAYVSPRPARRRVADTVEDYDISWPRLYFDTSPTRNPRTYRRLLAFGDDSRHYTFKLAAAREIMRLWREDRDELDRLAERHGEKASAEEVLRPREDNDPFEDADALHDAYEDGDLIALPDAPRALGYEIDPKMGVLARRLDESPALYRGARPEALAVLLYVAKEYRKIEGPGAPPLRVTSTVRDQPYQDELLKTNIQATRGFSLHTTGYAIDVLRPRRKARERSLVAVLERLRALHVIDFVYEPAAFHFTVGPDGEDYLPLLDLLGGSKPGRG